MGTARTDHRVTLPDGSLTETARRVMQCLARSHEHYEDSMIPFRLATACDPQDGWPDLIGLSEQALVGIGRHGTVVKSVFITVEGWKALGRTRGAT